MISGKGDNIYFSAAQMEPEMHPLMQVGMSMVPYALMLGGGYYAAHTPLSPTSEMSYLDLLASKSKALAAKTPLGIASTFRIPEFLSYYTSAAYKGMEMGQSSIDPSRRVGKYFYDAGFFKSDDQLKFLRTVLREETYNSISMRLKGDDYRFVLEQGVNERGSASLIFEDLERINIVDPNTQKITQETKVKSSRLLTNKIISAEALGHQPEIIDAFSQKRIDLNIQPVLRGGISNLDIGVNPDNIFRSMSEGEMKYASIGFLPSASNDAYGGIQGIKNRSAAALSYLTFGMSRFNKVLKATFEQAPIIGNIAEKGLQSIGISPYTGPQPFYKQFLSLGIKMSAIGAAYMGLRTVDHYRRNFGIVGHLIASAGVSAVGAAMANKALQNSRFAMDKSLPKKIGLGLFALQMFPGFSQGTVEGVSSTFANLDIMRSYVGKFTGLSGYRRTLEGLMPGISSAEVGVGVGIGLAIASYAGLNKYLVKNQKKILPDSITNRIGFYNSSNTSYLIPMSEGESLNRKLYEAFSPKPASYAFQPKGGLYERYDNFRALLTSQEYADYFNEFTKNKSFSQMSEMERRSLRKVIQGSSGLIANTYNIPKGEASILADKLFLSTKTESRIDFFESYINNNPINKSLLNRLEEIDSRYQGTGFLGSVAKRIESMGAKTYHAFFGASMAGEEYEEGVRKLGGSTHLRRAGTLFLAGLLGHQVITGGLFGSMEDPSELKDIYEGKKLVEIKRGRFWEGGGTPYQGMETNYFRPHQHHLLMTKAYEKSVWGDEHDLYNPITKFFLKNFTYHLEEKNYYDRPYPITAPAFEELPVIGPLLAATIGSLVKPVKFMHEDEFMQVNEFGETEFAYREEYGSPASLGGAPPGKPITPNNLLYRLGQIQYQQRELEGITGYGKNVLQKMFTGRETLGTMMPVMEDSGRMDSSILNYWDMELGGMMFMSEGLRRLLPRPKAEQERYNPIMNSMPSWLPDRFRRGDPYRAIPTGHSRLPGKAYESLYPELTDTPAEEYPLIHKYKILADVAPKSSQTFRFREQLLERRAAGATTDYENQLMDQIFEQHAKQLSSIQDFDFHQNAIKIPGISNLVSSAYKTGETIVRKVAAPAEYLVPAGFRPAQKLLGGTRGIVETYEYDQLYGTPHAFWDAPIRDWIRPSLYSAANAMGYDGKPHHVQKREMVNEHFDKLQFIKYTELAKQATNPKDKNRYLRLASRTRAGVNPQGNALGIYMSLPEAEKKYFDAFANADASDRDRILEMMPQDQAHLYQSIWNRMDTGNTSLYENSAAQVNESEMMQKSMELQSEMQLPPVDWVGWHKDVDLEDIKLKYISSLGEDIHDYHKFDSSLRRLQRRSYLDNSENFVYIDGMPNSNKTREYLANYQGIDLSEMQVYNSNIQGNTSTANINYNYDRTAEVLMQMERMTR